jgi:hypothetical protein
MRADGRTAMTKLIVVFRNFANAPKNTLNWLVVFLGYIYLINSALIRNSKEV